MLKVRVIPTLLWKQFGLVKGVGFDSWRRVGPVLPAVKVYNQREVDELVLVDIVAHLSTDDPDFESIDEFGQDCFVPLQAVQALGEQAGSAPADQKPVVVETRSCAVSCSR